MAYTGFKVLLDNPAEIPGLGYRDYAEALGEIIVDSRPEFAVGIFGGWGSGKTTLMRAIERQWERHPDVIPVWFTAWRYEKEPHLIVPLLDVLREELSKRAAQPGPQSSFRSAAAAVARAARAFMAGLTVTAKLPGMTAQVDPEKIISALKSSENDGSESLSFYQVGFVLLRDAIRELSDSGARRVVVFVDDLDRCLPENALDLLESMKLFFDVEGCVFVVGLDQEIAERAVEFKYRAPDDHANQQPPVSGNDYIKKIFQVPFVLPRIATDQLGDYLTTIANNSNMGPAQRQDFNEHVRGHLAFLPGEDSVNPREVKRLINAYTLQLKMLSARLGDRLDPNVVLALQCMSFRPDWRLLYDHLAADPQVFQATLRDIVDRDPPPDAVWLSGTQVGLPTQFVRYLTTLARPLLGAPDLRLYVSAAESTRSTDPSLLAAQTTVNRVRQTAHAVASGEMPPPEAASRLTGDIPRLNDIRNKRALGIGYEATVNQLAAMSRELTSDGPNQLDATTIGGWSTRFNQILNRLDAQLGEARRQANVGAHS